MILRNFIEAVRSTAEDTYPWTVYQRRQRFVAICSRLFGITRISPELRNDIVKVVRDVNEARYLHFFPVLVQRSTDKIHQTFWPESRLLEDIAEAVEAPFFDVKPNSRRCWHDLPLEIQYIVAHEHFQNAIAIRMRKSSWVPRRFCDSEWPDVCNLLEVAPDSSKEIVADAKALSEHVWRDYVEAWECMDGDMDMLRCWVDDLEGLIRKLKSWSPGQ